MSEQINHLAILDDCRRLAVDTDENVLAEQLRTVLERRHDAARMGSLSRGNNSNILPMVKKAREYWDERAGDDHFERTFAFGLGWHVHRATDRYFKPTFREIDPEYGERDTRPTKYYHEAVLFEEVYDDGEHDPFVEGELEVAMGSHPGSDALDVSNTEELFRSKWMVELVAAHEFVVDAGEEPEWDFVDELIDSCQDAYPHYNPRYFEEARYDPDPHRLQAYINEPPFYDADDPIIDLARSIQRGEETDVTLAEALESPGESHYAEALRLSFAYLESASELFTGERTEREAAERYGIAWMYESDDGWDSPPVPRDVDADPSPRPTQSLTEMALIEDLTRLAMWDETLSERTRESLVDNREEAALGTLAPVGEWLVDTVLDAPRSRFWFRRQNSLGKIAFVAGALTAETAREYFGDAQGSEDQLARDVTVLRERSAGVDPNAADADTLADLIGGLLPRSRQRWHTLRPDTDNVEAWSHRFFDWRDDFDDDVSRYAEGYASGVAAEDGFYDANDPLVELARAPKDGLTNFDGDLETALAAADEQSEYAQVLAEGIEHVRAVDAYVDGRDDGEALRGRID